MTLATTGKDKEFDEFQVARSGGETEESGTGWVSKLNKTFKKVVAGTYQITYNCQIYCKTADTQQCQVRLMVNGSRVCADHNEVGDTNNRQSTGIVYVDYPEGAQPDVSLDFRRRGGSGTVAIKRANIGLVKVLD